ncbi:D-TA family PLP-dependent enzyme [Pedobacter sp. AW1-32]|uniref:D-TA family PLP-dependent enzyme n=1 Tax=Pedobacter sp. AW1-32 TaxID=3383026 RepID=UPI003FED8BF6
MQWYTIPNVGEIESPGLVFYVDRMISNIKVLKAMLPDLKRLRPHVKTHKCLEVSGLMIAHGITHFKCATIAEAEMLGESAAEDVLLAYQPVGPNLLRFAQLQEKYPQTRFSCLVDNAFSAGELADVATDYSIEFHVYIDVNVGMNRTGIIPTKVSELATMISETDRLKLLGLHAYDGHIHDEDFAQRGEKVKPIIASLTDLQTTLQNELNQEITVIAGGTPTFPMYAATTDFVCSPGTFILWDKGYQAAFKEQEFLPAALIVSRIISLPEKNVICTDLGHKAVAAENILSKRVSFLNAPELLPLGQSEEHLTLEAKENHSYKVGDVLYGIPFHVCPTVALHEFAYAIQPETDIEIWPIIARKRKITI